MAEAVAELVHRGDLDALTVAVDRLANRRDWAGLRELRDRCLRAAEDTGRQLFGPAQYAAYRMALEAPADVAVAVLEPGVAPFALGPLTEVVAQHHGWEELADLLAGQPPVASTVAQERVLRGEDLTGDPRAHAREVGLPLRLQPWEPAYPLPRYRDDQLLEGGPDAPSSWDPSGGAVAPGRPSTREPLGELAVALRDLAVPWEEQSTGEVHVAATDGTLEQAIAALLPGDFQVARVGLATAFSWMAWAAASGGALGRRRGLAGGRAGAWWVGHVATGVPLGGDPDDLEFELEELEWALFRQHDDDGAGWRLQLAVAHPVVGWAAAIDARDRAPDPEQPTVPAGPAGSVAVAPPPPDPEER